jgi:hypothetical protein
MKKKFNFENTFLECELPTRTYVFKEEEGSLGTRAQSILNLQETIIFVFASHKEYVHVIMVCLQEQ